MGILMVFLILPNMQILVQIS